MIVRLEDLCTSCEPLSQRDEWKVVELWKVSFIPELKAWSGKWPSRNPKTHDFIFEVLAWPKVHCLRGVKAEYEYGRQRGTEVLVALSAPQQPVYRCCLLEMPPVDAWWSMCSSYFDVAAFDVACAWTLLITHEDEVCFSYSKMQESRGIGQHEDEE